MQTSNSGRYLPTSAEAKAAIVIKFTGKQVPYYCTLVQLHSCWSSVVSLAKNAIMQATVQLDKPAVVQLLLLTSCLALWYEVSVCRLPVMCKDVLWLNSASSQKWWETEPRMLQMTHRKSHKPFHITRKPSTLDTALLHCYCFVCAASESFRWTQAVTVAFHSVMHADTNWGICLLR